MIYPEKGFRNIQRRYPQMLLGPLWFLPCSQYNWRHPRLRKFPNDPRWRIRRYGDSPDTNDEAISTHQQLPSRPDSGGKG